MPLWGTRASHSLGSPPLSSQPLSMAEGSSPACRLGRCPEEAGSGRAWSPYMPKRNPTPHVLGWWTKSPSPPLPASIPGKLRWERHMGCTLVSKAA